jgi:excisionase family DNA binding protein
MQKESHWISVEDAAPLLSLKPEGVYRAIREGIFPFRFVRIGRQIRISAADLLGGGQSQTASARAEAA